MSTEIKKKIELEVVHVLFLDIVGYSKRLTNEQQTLIDQLNQVVRSSEEFQSAEAAGRLIKIPTGDGMALVFYKSPAQPVECALEISRALKTYPELRVRMGVHSGPVSAVTDLNDRTNAAGIGINIAQRVMDCGDAGHILLSQRVAEDLSQYGEWQPQLHDLGEVEVKHGVRVHVFNLCNKEVGNPEMPEKLRQAKGQTAPALVGRGEELWVAVLSFKSSGDAEMESFANGLGEDITTGLSRFRYLSVVASASAARLKGETGDERALGAQLGARYVLEGSIRKGGSGIRVGAQLVDTQTGAQLWAETYNRDLQTSTIFDAQDDIAARIVATVADSYGVLVHSMRAAIRQKDDADLTPAEWQFQYFAYREQITPAAHGALRSRLERAAGSDNRPSDLWACLAQIYVDEYAFGFPGDDETSLDRALAAARRGVELDRANQFAMVALAQTHFFRQDLAAFGPAAERAMALNPLNTDALGILGLQIVHTGEFERGTAIVRRAMELNANHAGWMHFAPLWSHFQKGEYEQALECANRVDVPGLFWPYLVMASACGHLGRRAEAAAAVRDLLALDPEFAAHARSNVGTWHFASGLMDPILDGLRKAGLSIPENGSSDSPRRNETITAKADRAKSGAVRAEEGASENKNGPVAVTSAEALALTTAPRSSIDVNNAFEVEALATSDLQNLTERGVDMKGKHGWCLDCEIGIRNRNPTQGIGDVALRILSIAPPMIASPAHYPRTQDTTLRRVQFCFTDIPIGKSLMGDQTGHVRIFKAARRIKFSEGTADTCVQFYGTWPDNLKTEFVPQTEHLLTVEVTGSGVRRKEALFKISFSTQLEEPVFTVSRIDDMPEFAFRKRRALYETVAADLAKASSSQFAGLKCLQDAGADTLESNDDLVWVCDNLARDGYEHPFYYFDEHIPQTQWLIFIKEARKSGIDFGDDMATMQWFMETHP